MLEDLIRLNTLYDFYGQLLTENQNKSFVYYYRYDYSLSEIGKIIGISRQGVSDNLKRATQELESFEENLKLYEKSKNIERCTNEIEMILSSEGESENKNKILEITKEIVEELKK